jgi:hypothetical protein
MIRKDLIIAVLATFCLATVLFTVIPVGSYGTYDPWLDYNDDGKIDARDVAPVAAAYGSKGTPLDKASIEYDSGWVSLTDKCGQYVTVTHNFNNPDVIVDITGKVTLGGGIHQRYLGLTEHRSGWAKSYGSEAWEEAHSVIQTSDGGYAIAGSTNITGAGGFDFFLIKTDMDGNMQWNKTFGGELDDWAYSLAQRSDGGYMLLGSTAYNGFDALFYKIDSNGNMISGWTYGGSGLDEAWCIIRTSDNHYAACGHTTSWGNGVDDVWLFKFDDDGNVDWMKTYDGTNGEGAYSVVQTNDGGYALTGYTWSYGAGDRDFYLIKTDGNGNMQWNKTYGGTAWDWAWSGIQTDDGGYALTGYTTSFGAVAEDSWTVKTDAAGNIQWDIRVGGPGNDEGRCIKQTNEGGYVVSGLTDSYGAGAFDFWLMKFDLSGNLEWNRTYGGIHYDEAYSMVQNSDGSYTMVGKTDSVGVGSKDIYLITTDSELGLAWTDSTANTITLYRGATDVYWNFVRVRLWKPRQTP